METTPSSRKLGVAAAATIVVLALAYAAILAVGLLSLDAADEPIGNPMFSFMEALIIALAPAMVVLMIAVHASSCAAAKPSSLAAVVFMSLLACVTSSVHFTILAISGSEAAAHSETLAAPAPFKWPSVAYALDILAWDFFFALSVLFAAPAFADTKVIRGLLVLSGILSLAGLLGVPFDSMPLRNIGIMGYVGVFPLAAGLIGLLFYRARPA